MKTENIGRHIQGEVSERKLEKTCQSLIEALKERKATPTNKPLETWQPYEFEGVTFSILKRDGTTSIAVEYQCS